MVYHQDLTIMPRDNTLRPEPAQVASLIKAWLDAGYILRPGSPAHQEIFHNAPHHPAKQTGAYSNPNAFYYATEARTSSIGAMYRWLMGHPPQQYVDQHPTRPFPIPPDDEALSYISSPYAGVIFDPGVTNHNKFGLLAPLQPASDPRFEYNYHYHLQISDDFIEHTSFNVREMPITKCRCGEELRYGSSILRTCPACGLAFRPQDQLVPILDAWKKQDPLAEILIAGGICYRFAIVINCCIEYNDSVESPELDSEPKATEAFFDICREALGFELYEVSSCYEE